MYFSSAHTISIFSSRIELKKNSDKNMKNNKSIYKLFLGCIFGYALIAFTANTNAQENEKPEPLEDSSNGNVSEDTEMDKGKKGKKEYESIEDFMEDGEFI